MNASTTPAALTPNSLPTHCAVCGAPRQAELPADAAADCSGCGCNLLLADDQAARLRERIADSFGVPTENFNDRTPVAEFAEDSLSMVELLVELEEELESHGVDAKLSDEEIQGCETMGDVLRLMMARRSAAGID